MTDTPRATSDTKSDPGRHAGHTESWIDRLLRMPGIVWHRTTCALSNLRRRIFKRRLPDYVVITLAGEVLERAPDVPWYYTFLPTYTAPASLEAIANALERVAGDPDVKGVLFLFKGAGMSLAQAQSLGALFERFRRWDRAYNGSTGTPKQIVVHLEELTAALYVAAAGADKVTATPLTEWDVKGLLATPTFLKETLARAGIAFDVVRVAPWKTAADSFALDGLSDAARDQYNWLFDSLFQSIVGAIATGRTLSEEAVKALIDQAPLAAGTACAAGLFDHVAYEDELPAYLRSDQPARLQRYGRVRRLLYRRPRRHVPASVGVISLRGSILTGESRTFPIPLPLLGDETLGSTTAQQLIRQARKDGDLGAVVVHVDSPGGSALASDLIWRELVLLDREKPVVVYMGDVAASGGYYIAAPGRKIVAQRATITGSIGVIIAKALTAGALDKIDMRWEKIQRGAHADLYSSFTPWEGDHRRAVEASLDQVYRTFKQRVADGRKLALETLDDLAGGRVWTGEQALAHGLVDALGDFQTAVELACAEAGLPTDGRVRVVHVHAPGKRLLAEPAKAVQAALGVERVQAWGNLADLVAGGELARLLLRERTWMLAENLPRLKR
jgi:protease IV